MSQSKWKKSERKKKHIHHDYNKAYITDGKTSQ